MNMSETSSSSGTTKISTFVLMIVFMVLALSLVAIALAVNAFVSGEEGGLALGGYLLAIGFIAMTLSAYVLLQSRRRVMSMKIEKPSMMTTIECKKCGVKSVREFQRGDYVFKELEPCQKCPDDKMLITAIYKEVKEKEKTFPF
jgi:hypothetical protein